MAKPKIVDTITLTIREGDNEALDAKAGIKSSLGRDETLNSVCLDAIAKENKARQRKAAQ